MSLIKVHLRDVLDVKRGASLSGEYYSESGKYIRLTLGNFNYPNGGFKENTSKKDIYFTGEIKPEFILKKGDIITPLTEQVSGLLGETARIPEDNKYIQSGDVGLIIPNESKLNKDFAYYLISSSTIRKQLDASSQQTKIRHTSPEYIRNCLAWIPNEIKTQKDIANILDCINNKIKINNKIISEIEPISKTLFDYWFLQFEFPDENGKPYKSSGGKLIWNNELKRDIPENWIVSSIGEHITTNRGISYSTKDISGGGIPMLNLATFSVDSTFKEEGLKTFSGGYPQDKVLKPYDLVMCNTQQTDLDPAKDIIGKSYLVPDVFDTDTVSSHHVTTIKTETDNLKYYLNGLFHTTFFHKYISGYVSGTSIMGLNFKGVMDFKIAIPTENILKQFATISKTIEKQKSKILRENKYLINLRDFLLPMLMNGQINIIEE